LDAIYYGFVVAYIAANYQSFYTKIALPAFIIGVIGICTLMFFQKSITDNQPTVLINTFFTTALSIAIAFIIPYLSLLKSFKYKIVAKIVTAISIISYSLYLINNGVVGKMFWDLSNKGEGWSVTMATSMYILYWVVSLGLSTLIFVFFEKPMTDLRNKFK
jgi:peptidoglycan/LPS O-acetylase OafA/YrhL